MIQKKWINERAKSYKVIVQLLNYYKAEQQAAYNSFISTLELADSYSSKQLEGAYDMNLQYLPVSRYNNIKSIMAHNQYTRKLQVIDDGSAIYQRGINHSMKETIMSISSNIKGHYNYYYKM
ncbi:MAG: hypothetical protein ACLUA3_08780 [Catenibacterium sp.]|jgi:hypothetical protein|uniref:hypothetical protein n=1 Tax=Catenibacterium sp. TaxID=2049022 RepID=UPI003991643E